MNNEGQARQLDELAAAARALPAGKEFPDRLLAVLLGLLAAVEEVRGLLAGKVKSHYTVEEVAELAGRSAYTVRRWIKDGKIEAARVEGTGPKGKLLVARSELAKLVGAGLADGIDDAVLRHGDGPCAADVTPR